MTYRPAAVAAVLAVLAALFAMLATQGGLPVMPYTIAPPLCSPLQAGQHALVQDGPHRFPVACLRDGDMFAWDATGR